ncbi:MAG: hypothetical protein JWM04_2471 [Verrucomicrobiales bacterium]|nr:hypothetical protein [Verrucomicrobiales bacterium]
MNHLLIRCIAKKQLAEIPIEKQVFDEVLKNRDMCLEGLGTEERFQLLIDNYFEFEAEFLSQSANLLIWDDSGHKAMDWRLALDRRFVNLLSACRLYMDQTDHALSTVFGNPSSELAGVKTRKSQLYDGSFSYRLMEELRNFVQHSGLVLSIIKFGHHKVELPTGKHTTFTVGAEVDSTSFHGTSLKKKILTELLNKPSFDIRTPVRDYISDLILLHKEVRNTLAARLCAARCSYSNAVEHFSTVEDQKADSSMFAFNESHEELQSFELIEDFLIRYDYLYARNSRVQDMRRRFVSNAIF